MSESTGNDRPALGDPEYVLESPAWMDRLRAADQAPPIARLGRFEVLAEVARGGQAVVYRAVDPSDGRIVALKCFTSFGRSGESAHLRLQREIRAARSLSHPGVVRVLGVESAGQDPLLVLEWIDGEPLDVWAARTAPERSQRESVELCVRICAVLVHAHQRGVIHRDLKPANILIDAQGMPHVVDFGLAKSKDDVAGRATAVFAGTLAYAAPEHLVDGWAAVDVRSDIYATGVLLYQLLSGRLPYELGNSIASAIGAIRRDAPEPLPADRVDGRLQAIVSRALAKNPENRYQSADAMQADLERFLAGEPVSARTAGTVARDLVRRHPIAAGLTLASVVGLLAAAGTMAVLYHRAQVDVKRTKQAEQFLATTLGGDLLVASPEDEQRDALLRASAAASQEWAGEPEIESQIRLFLARRFAALSSWPEVASESRRALLLLAADRKPQRVEALWYLGMGQISTGKENGEAHLQEALAIERGLPAPDATRLAGILEELGFVHGLWQRVPDFERATGEFQEAFEWRQRNGSANLAWVQGLHTYSLLQARMGDSAGALQSLDEALAMLPQVGHVSSRQHSTLLEAHAEALQRLGRLQDAERDYRAAIAIRNGAIDDRLPRCWAFLGDVVFGSGRPAEALELYETAIVTRCKYLEEQFPEDRALWQLLGASIQSDGLQAEEARELADRIERRIPRLIAPLSYTTRRIAMAHAALGHDRLSAELAAGLPAADAPLPRLRD